MYNMASIKLISLIQCRFAGKNTLSVPLWSLFQSRFSSFLFDISDLLDISFFAKLQCAFAIQLNICLYCV